ncbi:sulfurtransferase TusA family protein [Moorella naiadis]|uniref:sulfurtransferase TusA family protein n=1 Tax=Moorella naiadis (nom. illeg.) TaxID=3093670 RepID=UPI003D9C91E7
MAAKILDCRGMTCSGPLMATVKRMKRLRPGQLLEVWTDDLAAEFDLPAWCQEAGHTLVAVEPREDYYSFLIKKKE